MPRAGSERGATVRRCLSVLLAVSDRKGAYTVSDIVVETKLSYATVWGWLLGLEKAGIVEGWLDSAPSGIKGSGYKFKTLRRLGAAPKAKGRKAS